MPEPMRPASAREVFERYLEALQAHDTDALADLVHPEFEDLYAQSGEVTRGAENLKAIVDNYPGELQSLGRERVVGADERWVRTPMFTMLRVEGGGDVFTGVQRARYPDGSVYYIVVIGEMRDGLVYRTESFWAPVFDPPAWRAKWVEVRARPGE